MDPRHALRGLAIVCTLTGIGLMIAHLAQAGNFLVVGLSVTAAGLALGAVASAKKT
jgi:hypothetical protein